MGKLAPERFEAVFLYKNRRGFFFGNKILGWIDHLSPGARLVSTIINHELLSVNCSEIDYGFAELTFFRHDDRNCQE